MTCPMDLLKGCSGPRGGRPDRRCAPVCDGASGPDERGDRGRDRLRSPIRRTAQGGAVSLKKDVIGVTLQVALGVALAASESR